MRRTVLLAFAVMSPVAAQTFEPLPFKDVDPAWHSETDPTLNCDLLPESGPDPRAIGLTAAIAAVERRELTIGGLGYTLTWADREGDPAHIPALKRIAEGYRCFYDFAELAVTAIEAAGEPRDYFLALAADWARDDHLAAAGMNAMAIRGDSAAYAPLRAIGLAVPESGRFGVDLTSRFNDYLGGMNMWAEFEGYPVQRKIDFGARSSLDALRGPIVRTVRGDSVSQQENFNGGRAFAMPRRALRRMARAYPSAVGAALVAYADTAQSSLLRRGVTSARVPLYLALVNQQGPEIAFPSTAPPLPPVVTSAAITVSTCVEEPAGGGPFTAVFSYTSAEPAAVRVPYGPDNTLYTPYGSGAVAPEVFFPDAQPDAPGRTFRVAFTPPESVSWSFLGQFAFAWDQSPRCGAPVAPVCWFSPATVWVDPAGIIHGGPLDGQLYAGTLTGTLGPDVIAGTSGPDVIDAGDGDDAVCGFDGNDDLRGDGGIDTVIGGADDDALDGGPGNDTVYGDDPLDAAVTGADTLSGGDGDDTLFSGPGDDTLDGNDGDDFAFGEDGIDACIAEATLSCESPTTPVVPVCWFAPATVWVDALGIVHGGPLDGQAYAGTLTGTSGPDVIAGTAGTDLIDAGDGDDAVCGLAGNDDLRGGGGTDTVIGGADDDALDGGPGDDTLYGDDPLDPTVTGNDTLAGGDGGDFIVGGPGDDTLDGNDGDDFALGEDGTDACTAEYTLSCENATPPSVPACFGTPATIYVDAAGLVVGGPLGGQPYTGTLTGTSGIDVIVGTTGPDLIDAGDGDDKVCGGAGDDDMRGGSGNDSLVGGSGDDTITGGDGTDGLIGDDPLDPVVTGDDTLTGGLGTDFLLGGPGDDLLEGGPGDDFLDGSDGTADAADGGDDTDACAAETEVACEGPISLPPPPPPPPPPAP